MDEKSTEKVAAIISCYFHHNYGSMLQAYATQMVMDKLGYKNETIDVSGFDREIAKAKMKYFIKASLTSDILFSKLGLARSALKRKLPVGSYAKRLKMRAEKSEAFRRKHFRLSEQYASKEDLGKRCTEKYDIVLVGSDQLWTPGNIAAGYYTLNFVPESVNTIAYATSFGQAFLPKGSEEEARVFLNRIRHIGVREESGRQIVEALTGRKVPVVCDPTLLLTDDEWLSIQKMEPIIKGKYILCYFLGTSRLHREFVKRLHEETGHRIITLPHLDEYVKWDEGYADETLYDIDPADFLNLVRHAEYVCTDSYHCTVFSALYRRTFFTFRRYTMATKQSTNSRLDTLLQMMGLTERLITGNEDIRTLLNMEIDFDTVHRRIAVGREMSYGYLTTSLADKGSTDL